MIITDSVRTTRKIPGTYLPVGIQGTAVTRFSGNRFEPPETIVTFTNGTSVNFGEPIPYPKLDPTYAELGLKKINA